MCGIVGCTGKTQAAPNLLKGLERLEYRGYDSSGIAVINSGEIEMIKAKGRLSNLAKLTDNGARLHGTVGIGHTRWATHGEPSDVNSHPHISDNGKLVVVHNGIIENYLELRNELIERGFEFKSETDTETVVQLLEYYYRDNDILNAICKLINKLEGSYALGILCSDTPDTLYAVRKDNPLVLGLGKGANYIASDIPALLEHTNEFVLLEDRQFAVLKSDSIKIYNSNIEELPIKSFAVDWNIQDAEKGGYPHFMLKEIHEQPQALKKAILPRVKGDDIILDKVKFNNDFVKNLRKIDIIGCGSAYHAGVVGKYFIEKHCRIDVNADIASEYRYRNPMTGSDVLTIIISQSGETADTLAALRIAKERGSRVLAIVNTVGSSIAREADDVLLMLAGPEIAVATTKGYTTQVAILQLVGLYLAKRLKTIDNETYKKLLFELVTLSNKVELMLKDPSAYQFLASKYFAIPYTFYIGRGLDYASSLEGALKLKEISYIHAEAYAAGELKHGTISLIEQGTFTVAVVTDPELKEKTLSNIEAVKARGAVVFGVLSDECRDISDVLEYGVTLPTCASDITPVLSAVALQLFAYYVAVTKDCDVDKPRNLAKSVTVE